MNQERVRGSRLAGRASFAAAVFLALFLAAAGCAKKEGPAPEPASDGPEPPAEKAPAERAPEAEPPPPDEIPPPPGLDVDEEAGRLSFGARVAEQDVYEELKGEIEYVVVFSGGKEYESLFVAPVDPMGLHGAMKRIGLSPGRPAEETDEGELLPPEGSRLRVFVETLGGGGAPRRPIESFVLDTEKGGPMEPVEWVFAGSREGWDPETETTVLQVVIMKNLMGLYHADASVLVQNPGEEAATSHRYKPNREVLPAEGTPVRIVFEAVKGAE
jgi:hypothetical protein